MRDDIPGCTLNKTLLAGNLSQHGDVVTVVQRHMTVRVLSACMHLPCRQNPCMRWWNTIVQSRRCQFQQEEVQAPEVTLRRVTDGVCQDPICCQEALHGSIDRPPTGSAGAPESRSACQLVYSTTLAHAGKSNVVLQHASGVSVGRSDTQRRQCCRGIQGARLSVRALQA